MAKFKLYDKVRLVSNNADSANKVGDVGTIVEVGESVPDYRVHVKGNRNVANWSYEYDLELVRSVDIRIGHYKEALEFYEGMVDMDNMIGMCRVLGNISYGDYMDFSCPVNIIELEYPELLSQKPEGVISDCHLWWSHYDKESRIAALKAAIALAESA